MTFVTPPSPSSLHDADALVFTRTAGAQWFNTVKQGNQLGDSQITKRKVRHCDRQKHQKDELTQQIASLSALLQQKQARKQTGEELQTTCLPTNLVWETWARRQIEGRLASEAQQSRLRTAIMGNAVLIDDLQRVVRQHLQMSALNTAQSLGRYSSTDALLYVMDLRDIIALYHQTDSVFRTCGLELTSAKTTSFQRAVMRDDDGLSIQYVRRQHMLFNYEQTCQSMWMLSHLVHRQKDREDYHDIQDPANTIATEFRITKRLPEGAQLSLKERFVSRRFDEDTRTVLVWKAFLAGEGSCMGMQTEETGWSVIRPSKTGTGTVVEVCMRQVPLHVNSTNTGPANLFDNFLQTVIRENSQEITNGAKALLLENMLSGISA
ncbi:unnamed protein product [Phytophthora lilii]|uniref:Unnamed protein product n=1 Tax=Phytophthora lilii TaxID=2077276 RepID=A0A9W6WQE1_9STRA|nr:unnamed protein product [Phytophthora lilii]